MSPNHSMLETHSSHSYVDGFWRWSLEEVIGVR